MNSSTATHTKRTLEAREADFTQFAYGKLPPQAPKLEEAILGAIMLDKDAISVVVDILKAESFYDPRNQKVYAAMLHLFAGTKPIDMLTVTECLRSLNFLDSVGGAFYLSELTSRVASAANIEYHARIVEQKYIRRKGIQAAQNILKRGYEEQEDTFDYVAYAENQVNAIFDDQSSDVKTAANVAGKLLGELEIIAQSDSDFTGVPTGFIDIDRATGGLQKSDLIILAARTGMGKTSWVISAAKNTAELGKPVAIFSLEMKDTQLMSRIVSAEAEVNSEKMRNGNLEDFEWNQLNTAIEKVSELPIYIDDTPGINISYLRAKCRRLKKQNDIQLIIIDYLQLMSASDEAKRQNREVQVSEISKSLKALAKEIDVPVIALSQLSRAVETRGGTKRPQLSDLRESGSIEHDADMVMFIYRPEYYNIMEDEEGHSLKGLAEIIFAKNRHGATKTIKQKFIHQFAKFDDCDEFTLDDYNAIQSNSFPVKVSKMNSDEDVPF